MGLTVANGLVTPIGEREALSAGIVLPIVSVIVVLLRFGTRRWQGSRWTGSRYGPDDWLVLAGLPFLVGMGVCIIISATQGLGRYNQQSNNNNNTSSYSISFSHHHHNSSNITLSNSAYFEDNAGNREAYESVKKSLWAFQLLMLPMSACAKLSIIFFYRRIFAPEYFTNLWRASLTVGCLVTLSSIIFVFLNIFNCGAHVSYNWAPLPVYSHHCWSVVQLEQPYAIVDLTLNLLLLALPLPTLHLLQLSLRRRVAVGSVVLLGSCAIGASAVRVVLFSCYALTRPSIQAGLRAATDLTPLTDTVLHVNTTMMYWSLIEGGLAIQTACLPTLCVLLPGKVLGKGGKGGGGAGHVKQPVTQPGRGGRREGGHADGGDLTLAPGSGMGYGCPSGWFVKPRPLDGDGNELALGSRGPGAGLESFISELNLDDDDEQADEPERGRTRERVVH